MRLSALIPTTILLTTTSAQLIPFFSPNHRLAPPSDRSHQQAIMPGNDATTTNTAVLLSDTIGNQKAINIFAGFTRDIDAIAARLDNGGQNTTILAPLNSAISSLPRKPWEDPKDYQRLGTEAYAGQHGSERAQENLKRFVDAHVVPCSPWKMGEKVKSLGGGTLWWEERDGKMWVQPGDVEVERVVSKVANGEVWVLKSVLNYAS